jgi:hypothetical protein
MKMTNEEDIKVERRPMTRRQPPKPPPAALKKKKVRKPLPLPPTDLQPRKHTAHQWGVSVATVVKLEITDENPDGLLHPIRISGKKTGAVHHSCEEVRAARQRFLAEAQGLSLPEGDQ